METVNFYEHIPKKYMKPQHEYDNQELLHIDLPIRAIIAGSSGTGKTNALINLINQFNCFDKFYLFVNDESESLYSFLIDYVEKHIGTNNFIISNLVEEVPPIEEFDPSINNLVIFDDMINQNARGLKNKNALDLFTMGRKSNISVAYITQDFFKLNLTVRKNCPIIILTRFDDNKDLDNILMKYKQNLTMDQIRSLYNYSVGENRKNIKDFFTICSEEKPPLRYRKGFFPIN